MNLEFNLSTAPTLQFPSESLSTADQELHEEAMRQAGKYLGEEVLLLKIIMRVDQRHLGRKIDGLSTFAYCLKYLKLSEAVAMNFINVARKSR